MVHLTSPTPRTLEESEITANTSTAFLFRFTLGFLGGFFVGFFYILFEINLEKIFSAHRLLNVRTKNGPITKLNVE